MIGHVGLHNHLSGVLVPPRPAGDLGEELEGSFAAPVVGEAQRGVRRDDTHQRHVREVVTLGDHLGADEDLGLPPSEGG